MLMMSMIIGQRLVVSLKRGVRRVGMRTFAMVLRIAGRTVEGQVDQAPGIEAREQGGDDPTLVLMNMQALMKNIAIAGGFLILAIHGPGSLSADAWRD